MTRKKYSEQVQNDYDSYASEVNDARQKAIEGMTTAGEQQMADLAAAEQARQTAYNDAQKMYQQRMNEGYTSFADIVAGDNARIRQAEQENAMQVAADRRAARWTGATELASSLANLIAVGGYNAVSQQYRPYSQDWMRKADMDARMNRARIDNLRERQKAMQAQLAQLKMGDAGRALQMAQEQAKNTYQHNLATAQARYNTTVNPLNEAAKAAEDVGKIRTQGSVQAANVGLHEQQLAQTAAHQAATLAETKRYHDAQLANQAAKAARGTGSGSGSKTTGLSLKVKLDGRDVTLNMDEKTYQNALKRGRPDLKKDVLAMVQKVNPYVSKWEDIEAASKDKKVRDRDGKKVDNPLYGSELSNIATILSRNSDTYTDGDWATIASFAEGNYDVTDNFNTHLYQVSKGAFPWATQEEINEAKESPEEKEAPATDIKEQKETKEDNWETRLGVK